MPSHEAAVPVILQLPLHQCPLPVCSLRHTNTTAGRPAAAAALCSWCCFWRSLNPSALHCMLTRVAVLEWLHLATWLAWLMLWVATGAGRRVGCGSSCQPATCILPPHCTRLLLDEGLPFLSALLPCSACAVEPGQLHERGVALLPLPGRAQAAAPAAPVSAWLRLVTPGIAALRCCSQCHPVRPSANTCQVL